MYGGTQPWPPPRLGRSGLSPRVRGNRLLRLPSCIHTRSIPACTGEPIARFGIVRNTRVYPRVYGGTPVSGVQRRQGQGLSPRVRGNPVSVGTAATGQRSIPACTGEPGKPRWRRGSRAVYPRVYGGTSTTPPVPSNVEGLSPRVRGNHEAIESLGGMDGSIPACTGEPVLPATA